MLEFLDARQGLSLSERTRRQSDEAKRSVMEDVRGDVNDLFRNYREACRHLWGVHIRPRVDRAQLTQALWRFESIQVALFSLLVLERLDIFVELPDCVANFPPMFEVDCRPGVEVDLSRWSESGWHAVRESAVERPWWFMDYFDWNDDDNKDYEYYMATVGDGPDQVLVKVSHADIRRPLQP